ncbi:TPA: respiratory nitrate reductase subunit gamma [Klebsiella pneumoniae]
MWRRSTLTSAPEARNDPVSERLLLRYLPLPVRHRLSGGQLAALRLRAVYWRASSSQMLDKRGMVLWSNLFHIGILGIFFGHLFGMLTPHWVYSWFLPMSQKQLMAMILGGICGVLTLVGGIGLLMRRLTNPRIRATSTTADILILCILLIQCALGLTTIPFSAQHPDGSEMLKLVDWAQAVVTFHGGASAHLDGVAWIYRVHLVLGMTIFLIFPFTRLVHVWSAPVEYFTRRYQVVRSRR